MTTETREWLFSALRGKTSIGECHFVSESVLETRIQIAKDALTKELYGVIPDWVQRQAKEEGFVVEFADFRKGRFCYRRLR